MAGDRREDPERFRDRYGRDQSRPVREVERRVFGLQRGVNGYTTAAEADRLGAVLRLGPTSRLLDLGAGRGWPGVYLAWTTGCRTVLSDVPHEGLGRAAERAREDGVEASVVSVAADASSLPFRNGVFDAVVHTDVLC